MSWVSILTLLIFIDFVEFKEANTFASKLPLGGLSEKLLVGYWGQNGAGPSKGKEGYGKPLGEVCQTTKFDIVNLAFLIWFFDSRNKDKLIIKKLDNKIKF